MIVEYAEEYLEELYISSKCSDKKHRYQQQVIAKYQRRIDTLIAATRIEDLFVFNSMNFESIDSANNLFSIRIDYHYRLIVKITVINTEPVVTIAKIIDISNHYQ